MTQSPKKCWYVKLVTIIVIFCTMFLITITPNQNAPDQMEPTQRAIYRRVQRDPKNWRGLSENEIKSLSVLGRRLFLGDESVPPRVDREFTILVWKLGPKIEAHYIYLYGTKWRDPFGNCSVSNCRITYNSSELTDADAVVFHLQKTPNKSFLPPKHGNWYQRWIFISDENPINTFIYDENTLSDYNGLFNWSMTYRMDSDVPVPYGRTIPLAENDVVPERWNKSKFVAIMISDCSGKNKRMEYLNELKRHLHIDVYGKCGTLVCAGHYGEDCPKLNDYMFYLAFENGDCKEYLTEKLWWNALNKDSVPVILGANIEDCDRLLPPNSFIHVRNFSSPASLAKYLIHLYETPSEYESYFTWKKRYKIVNEHGYFQAPVFHYCRVCEALNYNDPAPKVYNKIEDTWSDKDCYTSVDW